jgi:hypothetical protein
MPMNTQLLISFLNQLMKKENKNSEQEIFSIDETQSQWRREDNIELLKAFCPEGYGMAKKYGHFLVGKALENGETEMQSFKNYIGIPGRFLIEEQPAGGKTGFTLWQPQRHGEEMYNNLEDMDLDIAEHIYGYWIASIDEKTLKLSEV